MNLFEYYDPNEKYVDQYFADCDRKEKHTMTEKQLQQRRNAGKALFAKYGSEHMSKIGKLGAQRFHELYSVQPIGTKGWVIVGRKDNKIVSFV